MAEYSCKTSCANNVVVVPLLALTERSNNNSIFVSIQSSTLKLSFPMLVLLLPIKFYYKTILHNLNNGFVSTVPRINCKIGALHAYREGYF